MSSASIPQSTGCPTADWVRQAPYVELLALLEESNLPPGGFQTVRKFINETHLRPGTRVLHAGCNAGFLGREFALRSGAEVVGIDISPEMVRSAQRRGESEGLSNLVSYQTMDMTRMTFDDNVFDVVASGGSLAFVRDQVAAVREWARVCCPGGLIANAEFYYREPPPAHVRDRVGAAIQVDVPSYSKAHWTSLLGNEGLTPYFEHAEAAQVPSELEVESYCERMVEFSAVGWSKSAAQELHKRLRSLFMIFNENMKYLDCLVMVHRVPLLGQEPMLYV